MLKPLKVIVYIHIASKSTFERFGHKDAACKTEAFLHTLFLENEAQMDQKNYGTMLFMSKQVSLPKISPKPIYSLFARRPVILRVNQGLKTSYRLKTGEKSGIQNSLSTNQAKLLDFSVPLLGKLK